MRFACLSLLLVSIIATTSLQYGIGLGIVLAMLNFVVASARGGSATAAKSDLSKCRRDYQQRELLGRWQREGRGVVTLSLSGFTLTWRTMSKKSKSSKQTTPETWQEAREGITAAFMDRRMVNINAD